MRKLLLLAGIALVVALYLRRRPAGPRAIVGFEDGTTLAFEPGSPELQRLAAIAAAAPRA